MKLYRVLALIAISSISVLASEPEYAIQAHINQPYGDLRSSVDRQTGKGISLAINVKFELADAETLPIRFRLGWNGWRRTNSDLGNDMTVKLASELLSLEYLTFFRDKRTYVFLGIGGNRWEIATDAPNSSTSLATTKLAGVAGIGHRFSNNLHVEFDEVSSSLPSGKTAQTFRGTLGIIF